PRRARGWPQKRFSVRQRRSSVDARGCVPGGAQIAEGGMPSVPVVFVLPVADHDPSLSQGPEHIDVEAFIADPGVKRLDIAVTPRLPRRDKTQPDTLPGPVGHRGTRQLRAVIAAQHSRVATHASEAVEFV